VVLLGITATALGLIALVPAATALPPVAAPSAEILLSAQTVSAASRLPATGIEPARLDLLPHADRSRRTALPAPSPSPLPEPPSPPPVDVLPGCTVGAGATEQYANGQIPQRAMCALPGHSGHALRADAARGFVELDAAYAAAFGRGLCLTDSYRSLGEQRLLARQKPRLAARPGTSEHGLGVAVDLACGAESYRTGAHRWLTANAGQYGWYQPSWAQIGGSRPEPWHWEFSS